MGMPCCVLVDVCPSSALLQRSKASPQKVPLATAAQNDYAAVVVHKQGELSEAIRKAKDPTNAANEPVSVAAAAAAVIARPAPWSPATATPRMPGSPFKSATQPALAPPPRLPPTVAPVAAAALQNGSRPLPPSFYRGPGARSIYSAEED